METANVPSSPLIILFALFILAMLFASVLLWFAAITWLRMGGRSIPVEKRRPAPWGLIHFVGVFVLFVLVGFITIRLSNQLIFNDLIAKQPADQQDMLRKMATMVAGSFAQIVTMIIASGWIAVLTRCSAEDLGWSLKHIAYDILVGLGAAILFLPIIQILMASLVYWLDMKYDHPLLDALSQGPVLWMYLGAFFAAVIAAPITEEFLFRVLLQGMLEANATSNFTWRRLLFGTVTDTETTDHRWAPIDDAVNAAEAPLSPTPHGGENPYQASYLGGNDTTAAVAVLTSPPVIQDAGEAQSTQLHSAENAKTNSVALWPMLVTGTLFGLAHAEYGPSWIPLILMGFILGYLYRCTHRIWACWIVHIVLNGISMIGFGLQLLSGNPISAICEWLTIPW